MTENTQEYLDMPATVKCIKTGSLQSPEYCLYTFIYTHVKRVQSARHALGTLVTALLQGNTLHGGERGGPVPVAQKVWYSAHRTGTFGHCHTAQWGFWFCSDFSLTVLRLSHLWGMKTLLARLCAAPFNIKAYKIKTKSKLRRKMTIIYQDCQKLESKFFFSQLPSTQLSALNTLIIKRILQKLFF